jgi:uncharacterized protein (TIGR03435 family)
MRPRRIFTIGFLAAVAASGQTALPRFEVASVKPGGDEFSTRPDLSTGRLRWTTQLCYLIGYAYTLDFASVTGRRCGAVYSIEATFDPASTGDQVRLMIQSLLADRFKMQAHRVATEATGYALVTGKGGLKIKASGASGEPPGKPKVCKDVSPAEGFASLAGTNGPGVLAITGCAATMPQLAEALQRSLQMWVWDRTGVAGTFDFEFRYARDPDADSNAGAPALATALQETLGLKLEKQKGVAETLVIDSLEEPSQN